MEKDSDNIIKKIAHLRKIINDMDRKMRKLKSINKLKSNIVNKDKKRNKRRAILYDEIPQEVLDKSYSIFKSSKLLEHFYIEKYFITWSVRFKQKRFDECKKCESNNPNENNIFIIDENEKFINSNDNNEFKSLEQDKETNNLNSKLQESFEDHTEDKSKISINIDDEYSDENI